MIRKRPNILFVGNSFTHGHCEPVLTYNSAQITDANGAGYGGVPGIFKKLAAQAGYPCDVTIEAVSGESLAYHLANKLPVIGERAWDIVILQELSIGPLPAERGGDPLAFRSAADGLHDFFLTNNPAGRVLLYETWSSPASASDQGYNGALQDMQQDLQDAYYAAKYRGTRTADKPDYAAVVRVGDAFMRAVEQGCGDPDPAHGSVQRTFSLWGDDNKHPTPCGAFLSAAMFFGKITGLDPRTLSSDAGSAAGDLNISPTDGQSLLRLAAEVNALAEPVSGCAPSNKN